MNYDSQGLPVLSLFYNVLFIFYNAIKELTWGKKRLAQPDFSTLM